MENKVVLMERPGKATGRESPTVFSIENSSNGDALGFVRWILWVVVIEALIFVAALVAWLRFPTASGRFDCAGWRNRSSSGLSPAIAGILPTVPSGKVNPTLSSDNDLSSNTAVLKVLGVCRDFRTDPSRIASAPWAISRIRSG
jgi:hypothetical protein